MLAIFVLFKGVVFLISFYLSNPRPFVECNRYFQLTVNVHEMVEMSLEMVEYCDEMAEMSLEMVEYYHKIVELGKLTNLR